MEMYKKVNKGEYYEKENYSSNTKLPCQAGIVS